MAGPVNDTFLRALRRQPVPYTPVWMMRQAGRYLPEYNATRGRAGDFMALCRSTALATEVTLQPLERFALDAAILFSDILTVPDAMGLGLSFAAGEGPKFARPLRDERAIQSLCVPDMDRLRYVFDAVASIRHALNGRVPLIGFSGSPFTLACYMIEGGSSADFHAVKQMLYARPDLLHHVLAVNARAVADYLNEQIRAGAQAVMLFDTWGGMLAHDAFHTFSLQYLQHVIDRLDRHQNGADVPVILYTKGGGQWLEALAATGADCVGLDWTTDIGAARRRIGDRVALQGNLDPGVLFAPPDIIRAEVARVLAGFGHGSGHVFNLGHGISQHTDPARAAAMVDAVRELSRAWHTPA